MDKNMTYKANCKVSNQKSELFIAQGDYIEVLNFDEDADEFHVNFVDYDVLNPLFKKIIINTNELTNLFTPVKINN